MPRRARWRNAVVGGEAGWSVRKPLDGRDSGRFAPAVPITELRIEGLRTIEKVRLKLDGLTVLIGENGSGKSSIIEACEILRRARSERFLDEFYSIHGGFNALLRQGASRISVGVTVTPSPGIARLVTPDNTEIFESFDYDLTLTPSNALATIDETLRGKLGKGGLDWFTPRTQRSTKAKKSPSKRKLTHIVLLRRRGREIESPQAVVPFNLETDERVTSLARYGHQTHVVDPHEEACQHVASELNRIRVHLPFETMPAWAARALDRKSAMRNPSLFAPADHLEKLGTNVANAYQALKNTPDRAHWQQTLDYIRLGLGDHIEDVITYADPGGGHIGVSLKLRNLDRPIPAAQLSDGMLTYLALVAAFRLHVTRPSLLAFDEPDLHLHPHLLMRALDLFEGMAQDCPVLLATHSDRLLDGLSDPARSVVLCDLDQAQATRLVRPDPEALARWLERYRGLGDIRAAGHAASVMTRVEPA